MVNTPGDEYEQEADRVADQVMRMPLPAVQRACACGGACSDCRTEQTGGEHELLQLKRFQPGDLGEPAVPSIAGDVLQSAGQPIQPSVRAAMESRFGHDFSQVRVHTDANAADSANALGARAYTFGRNVVFGAQQYAPAYNGRRNTTCP